MSDLQPSNGGIAAIAEREAQPRSGWNVALFGTLLVALVCSMFATLGTGATAIWMLLGAFEEEGSYLFRLLVKCSFFGALSFGIVYLLRHLSHDANASSLSPTREDEPAWLLPVILVCVALPTLLLVLPNLTTYPWTAPDELHHLIVAKNLAEQNAYASGHPDGEFRYFDNYDSIGAPVIAPIAVAFKAFGVRLEAARLVIAVSYIVLSGLAFFLIRPHVGSLGAGVSVLVLLTSFGSVYLARSLYGEVPAFALFLAGLLAWRHSIDRNPTFAILAGVCFGLAALSKSILLITVCAFAVVWIFDQLGARKIRVSNVLMTAAGVGIVFLAWSSYKWLYRDVAYQAPSMIVYYRHYLVFGTDSLLRGAQWFLERPGTTFLAIVTLGSAGRLLLRKSLDPALMVLALTGVLFTFWWLFHTPGTIPRYLWFSFASVAIFSGSLLEVFRNGLAAIPSKGLRYAVAAVTLSVLTAPCLWRASEQLGLVYGADEMSSDRAAMQYLDDLPADATVATTFWPLERSAIFFSDRAIGIIENDSADYDYIIGYESDAHLVNAPEASLTQLENYVALRSNHGG